MHCLHWFIKRTKCLVEARCHLVVDGILHELRAPHVGGHLGQSLEPLEMLPDIGEVSETVRHQQQVLINQLVHHEVDKSQTLPCVPEMILQCLYHILLNLHLPRLFA